MLQRPEQQQQQFQQQPQPQQQQDDCGTTKGRSGGDVGARTVLYVAAVLWAQWSGSFVRAVGPYNLMVCGVCASACAGLVLAAVDQRHAASAFGVPVLQGFGCGSLAVAVPNYIVTCSGRSSRGESSRSAGDTVIPERCVSPGT